MEKPETSRSDPASRRAYTRWHYRQNKAAYKSRAVKHRGHTKVLVREFLFEYLKKNTCVDCPETDPVVMEFDHRDGEVKVFNIGEAITRNFSLKSVIAEVAKCDVRCANCHRRVTYRRAQRTHRGPAN